MKIVMALTVLLIGIGSQATTSTEGLKTQPKSCEEWQAKAALFLAKPALHLLIPTLAANPTGQGRPNVFNEYSRDKCDLKSLRVTCVSGGQEVTVKCGNYQIAVEVQANEEDGYIKSTSIERAP